MRNSRQLLTALLAVIALLGAACGGDDPTVGDVASEGAENALNAAEEARQTADEAAQRAEEAAEAADQIADDVADGPDTGQVSLEISDTKTIGDTVELSMEVEGVTIIAADGDTSGNSGHFHVFVDRDPVPVGEQIPTRVDGIIHSSANPIPVPGLSPGDHDLVVVLGNGNHVRMHDVQADTKVQID